MLKPPQDAGLRDEFDENDVLVCKAHYGRLRRMKPAEIAKLERFLIRAFADSRPPPSPRDDFEVRLIRVGRDE